MSIKALEIAEEKEAVAQYGSTDSGASLGDILGAALKQRDAELQPFLEFTDGSAGDHKALNRRLPAGNARLQSPYIYR